MLLKLMKYDLKYMFSKMIPALLVLVISSGLFIILTKVPRNNIIEIILTLVISALVFTYIVSFLLASYLGVYRFFTNVLKAQGYLTNTLPVKKSTIILANILSSILLLIVTVAILLGLGYVTTALTTSGFQGITISPYFNIDGQILFLQIIILCIITAASNVLFFNAALALGHSHSTNKILYSIAYGIGIYVIMQIVAVIFIVILASTGDSGILFIENAATNFNETTAANIILLLCNIFILIYAAIMFFLTNYSLSRKLNLQ